MHRLASVSRLSPTREGPLLVEQPPHQLLVLSTADSDCRALADLLASETRRCPRGVPKPEPFRALLHSRRDRSTTLSTSLAKHEWCWVRTAGGRGHWSYGLERLGDWGAAGRNDTACVGRTAEEEGPLAASGRWERGSASPSATAAEVAATICARC